MTQRTSAAVLIVLALALAPMLLAAGDSTPANVAGVWTWSQTRPDGKTIVVTLTLKQDNEKLNGTFHGEGPDSEIFDGSVHGNEMRFCVIREIEGHKVTLTYSGAVENDTVKGRMEAKVAFRDKKTDWSASRDSGK